MKTLIVYDSVFGNTQKVAEAIGASLGSGKPVEVIRVNDAKPGHLTGLDILIVGSPTRAFRATPAMNEFLDSIPSKGLSGIKVAAFDTRMCPADVKSRVLALFTRVFGYAAEPMAQKLVKKGGVAATPPEGFFVKDSEGPLKDGEIQRAGNWAKLAAGGR